MSATISLAKQESTGIIQHINEVEKEKAISFTCVGCGKEMIVVKSYARKRDWHFRHTVESACTGGRDTALHDYAIQVLMENKAIRIGKNLHISYTNPRKEVTVFGKRSDVTVTHENEDVHFEVFVTHDLGQEKISIYKGNKIKCVCIDLSKTEWLSASPEEIKEVVVNLYNTKTVIYWNDDSATGKSKAIDWIDIFGWVAALIGAGYLMKKLFGKSSKKRRFMF